MADELASYFETEEIPDSDILFMRVHRNYLTDGELVPGVFQNKPRDSGMSVDWSKYSSAEEQRRRARTPADNGVIKFKAGEARSIGEQSVDHDPILDNQAHSQVFGEKTVEVRARFMQIFEWELELDPLA